MADRDRCGLSSAVTARHSPRSSTVWETYPQDEEGRTLRRIALPAARPRRRGAGAASTLRRPGAQALLLGSSTRGALGADRPADRPPVLDRHARALEPDRDSASSSRAGVMRVVARRSQAYALEFAHLPIVDDSGSLAGPDGDRDPVLRNQIRPILTLAQAAEGALLGKGRETDFRPPGGRARIAARRAIAFIEIEATHRARPRSAHHHAQRRQPRPAHHPHALQASRSR